MTLLLEQRYNGGIAYPSHNKKKAGVSMKTLFLHIGLHKTGTTTVQQTFQAASHLFRRQGLDFIPIGRHIGGAQHNLAWEIAGLPGFDAALGTWDDAVAYMEASQHRYFLISAEDLSGISPAAISQLKTKLERFDVRVIATLRNQVDYLESLYNETGKMFCREDRPAFIERALGTMESILDFNLLHANWSNAFGAANLRFLVFENLKGDLFGNFCEASGIAAVIDIPDYRKSSMNLSTSAAFLEANRLFSNAAAPWTSMETYNEELVDVLNTAALELGWVKGRDPFFTLAERRLVHSRFLAVNRVFSEQVTPLSEDYFAEPESGANPTGVTAAEIAQLAMRALIIQRQELARDQAAFHRAARRFEEAEAIAEKALKLEPERPLLYQSLSAVLVNQGRLEEAEAHARRIVELAPESAQSYRSLGYVLKTREKWSEAENALRRAIKMDGSLNILPYLWLSEVRQAVGDAEEALALLNEAVEIVPNDPAVLLRKADLQESLCRFKKAEESFRQATASQLNPERAHYSFSLFLERRKRFRAALKEAKAACLLRPDSKAYNALRVRLQEKVKQLSQTKRSQGPDQQDHRNRNADN